MRISWRGKNGAVGCAGLGRCNGGKEECAKEVGEGRHDGQLKVGLAMRANETQSSRGTSSRVIEFSWNLELVFRELSLDPADAIAISLIYPVHEKIGF